MEKITNGTIEINGIKVTLLDDRVVDGVWVDPKDLDFVDQILTHEGWKDTKFPCASMNRYRDAARFKQPDRMELVWEYFADEEWYQGNEQFCKSYGKKHETRQRFILKDQEQEPKKSKPVSRSVYQKLAEENKRLLKDLKTLCFDTPSVDSITVKAKWKIHFHKEATFNTMMKEYATNYFKEHPEQDITKKP